MKRALLLNLLAASMALSALFTPATAVAQYVWLDEKGTKQFSDMPPPPSVPPSRILKQPGDGSAAAPREVTEEKQAAPSKAEPSIAEKNAEFRKRKAEQADKEKKAAEETERAAEKAKNCERAREYQRTLDSGERIVRRDNNGERAFLTDEQRTQEARHTRKILDDCK